MTPNDIIKGLRAGKFRMRSRPAGRSLRYVLESWHARSATWRINASVPQKVLAEAAESCEEYHDQFVHATFHRPRRDQA